MRILSTLLIVLVCLATPAAGFAQSAEQMEVAKGHFTKGAEFYASGEYSKAIVEFISGHNIAPNAMFLYNISLCYERLDNIPDAREAASRARSFEGMPDEVSVRNEARIASFTTILDARDVASEMAEIATTAPDSPKAENEGGFGALGWSGVALSSLGAAGLGFALLLNNQVKSDKEAIDEAAARNDFVAAAELTDEANATRSTGLIVLFAGSALAAVGVTMIAWDLLDDPDNDAQVSISPGFSGDEAGVVVHGRF
jgi:hypothetical protein